MVRGLRPTRSICWHTLDPMLLQPGRAVLDLGANIGSFSRRVVEEFGCICYSFEPDPELCRLIPRHPNIRVFEQAIAPTTGSAVLRVGKNRLGATILPAECEAGEREVTVLTMSLPDLLREHVKEPIAAVKMDIEGAEVGVIDSMTDDLLRSLPQMTIEFHDFNRQTPPEEVRRVADRLRSLGFFYMRMSGVGHQDTLFVNRDRARFGWADYFVTRYVSRNVRGGRRVIRRKLGLPVG